MHRHHPYGSSGYDAPSRRGGGPGPDRSHRYERGGGGPRGRGGFSRGRGSYSNYDNTTMSASAYHDSASGPPDLNSSYGSYDAPQDPYHQSSYANIPSQYSQGYDQTYGSGGGYEGAYGDIGGGGYRGGGHGGRRSGPRRERDDKVHDSIIEERISRERPCRTLFIRNIKYETNSEEVRRMFEEHGDIKTFFDLISNRGMVFVTFHDLRAAERARDRLQGSEISGRPIDVHYSLPRDDHGGKNSDKDQQYQGVIQVTLRSQTGTPIDENELRRKLQPFGDIKSIMPVDGRMDARSVEFYDMRASEDVCERLNYQPLQNGVMNIQLCWDNSEHAGGPGGPRGVGAGDRDYDEGGGRRGGRGGGRGGRGGRGRGGGRSYDDDYERRGDYGRDRRGPSGPTRYDDDYRGGYNDRGGYGGSAPRGPAGYGGPPPAAPPPASYSSEPPRPPPFSAGPSPGSAGGSEDRMEQARKVQQLLAALKQPQTAATPEAAAAPTSTPPPIAAGYYGQPPVPQPPYGTGLPPPSTASYGAPPSSSTPQPPSQTNATASLSSLPPHVYALLQQVQAQAQQSPPGAPAAAAPQAPPAPQPSSGTGAIPYGAASATTGTAAPAYQQLMSYLQSQKSG